MNINNLAPELKQLVFLRNKEQYKEDALKHHTELGAMFVWSNTLEGHDFWHRVDKGEDMTSHNKYPKPIESYQIY